MWNYIPSSLRAGIIRPSSPAGAGLFFVTMKDKSLQPCIEYRGLNNITIRTTVLFLSYLPPAAGKSLHQTGPS